VLRAGRQRGTLTLLVNDQTAFRAQATFAHGVTPEHAFRPLPGRG